MRLRRLLGRGCHRIGILGFSFCRRFLHRSHIFNFIFGDKCRDSIRNGYRRRGADFDRIGRLLRFFSLVSAPVNHDYKGDDRCPCENHAKKIGPFTAPGRRFARVSPSTGSSSLCGLVFRSFISVREGWEFNRNNQHCPVRFQAWRLRTALCSGCHVTA